MVTQFEKPAAGSSTAAFPELGTGPIAYYLDLVGEPRR